MHLRAVLFALPVALTLSACTGSPTRPATSGSSLPAPSPSTTSGPAAPTATDSPSATAPASATARASAAATGPSAASAATIPAPSPSASPVAGTPAAAPGPPPCAASELVLSVGAADAAAGTSYTPLVLRDRSRAACLLRGFPGVSFLDTSGRQVGRPADTTSLPRQTVVLTPTSTAYALLAIGNAGAYDAAECRPAPASQVRVYPPGERAALTAPFAVDVCTSRSVRQARVDPLRRGSGPNPG